MKFLRILAIIACLNIPCAHAFVPSAHEFILNAAKTVIVAAGVLTTLDGCCNAQFGTSPFLPLPSMSDNQFVERACKATVGVVEVGAGLAVVAYVLQ